MNSDSTFLQKIKDNAFYIALGIGILAVIAVVAAYTMGRDGGAYEDNDIDLNQSSDYSSVSDRSNDVTGGTDRSGRTKGNSGTVNRNQKTNNDDAVDNIPDTKASQEMQKKNIQISEPTTETANSGNAMEDGEQLPVQTEQLPVTADVGELNFGSDKTLSWPVSGEVILPYSMETTVYYKTLEQYQTNPGMLIAAGSGSTVKSAYLGKVTKVTSDNTYGNLVTMYIGNDYSIVYGQLDTIYVKEGDYVKAGESVGTIGRPTDSFLEEGSHLFFQLLNGDVPVDPMEFMQ